LISSLIFNREDTTLVANLGSTTTQAIIRYKSFVDLDELSQESSQHVDQVLTMFNNIVKNALKQKKYEQVGRFPKFFLAEDKIEIRQFKLFAWPGYEVKTKLSTQGIFLNVESCTKFVR